MNVVVRVFLFLRTRAIYSEHNLNLAATANRALYGV